MTGSQSDQVFVIAFTGSPGGGKTAALTVCQEWLEGQGYVVGVLRERFTELACDGLPISAPWEDSLAFQDTLLREQLVLENTRSRALLRIRSDKPRVLLCDRGALDMRAYLSERDVQEVLRRTGRTLGSLPSRYHGVIHFVTAAVGQEEAYLAGLAENERRTESVQQARDLDQKTREAWLGASRVTIIPAMPSFEEKLVRARAAIAHYVGIPRPIEREQRLLVKVLQWPLPIAHTTMMIGQRYLVSLRPDVQRRIRKRMLHSYWSYYYTEKSPIPGGAPDERYENDLRIMTRKYSRLLREADPAMVPIEKERNVFFWDGWYMELDEFITPCPGMCVLEIERTEEAASKLTSPSFIEVVKDITDDPSYGNYAIAKGSRPWYPTT